MSTDNSSLFRNIALGFLAFLSAYWAVAVVHPATPPAPVNADEISHLRVIEYMAEKVSFPPYDGTYYESIHPPLYYGLAAAISPLGIVAIRFLNVLFACLTLIALWRLVHLFKISPLVPTASFVFLPGFFVLGGSITNDVLAILLSVIALHLSLKGYREGFKPGDAIVLGLVLALGALTKYQCLALIPGALLALFAHKQWKSIAAVISVIVVISGWWYVRNTVLFGDPLRKEAEAHVLAFLGGYKESGAPAWEYWSNLALSSFITFPGTLRCPYPILYYLSFAALTIAFLRGLRFLGTEQRISQAIILIPAILTIALYLSYNYTHYMPNSRILYPGIAGLYCVSVGYALKSARPWLPLGGLLIWAMYSLLVMPNRFVEKNDAKEFTRLMFPYFTRELPSQ